MNKLLILLGMVAGFAFTNIASAAYVASMYFDDSAFVDGVSFLSEQSTGASISSWDGEGILYDFDNPNHTPISLDGALTDTSLNTYAKAVGTPSINMSFTNSVFDGDGADLAFFFIGYGINNTIGLTIGDQTLNYSAETLWIDETAGTAHGANGDPLAGIFVDLADFTNSDYTQLSLSDFDVTLGDQNWLALAGNFHTTSSVTTVPVPAAAWLFVTGAGLLGAVARKRKKA